MGAESQQATLALAHSLQTLSQTVHLTGLSVLSYCLSRRMPSFGRWEQWRNLSWSRICVIWVLVDSWLFVFFSGVLVNGVGLASSETACTMGIYACITFYALTKVFIYGFMSERAYIVWCRGNTIPRFRTRVYQICTIVLLGYVAVAILMIRGQNSRIREDGICDIGLKDFATIPLISYDLFLNVFLTVLFLWPLWQSKLGSSRLKQLAKRTLCGATASLISSATNVTIMAALRGHELGWICLSSCVTDVTFNALAIYWVTAKSSRNNQMWDSLSLPRLDMGILTYGQDSTLRPTQALPASYFDYLPHDQRPQFSPSVDKLLLPNRPEPSHGVNKHPEPPRSPSAPLTAHNAYITPSLAPVPEIEESERT